MSDYCSSSNVLSGLSLHDTFLNLSLLGFLQPSLNVLDSLVVSPIFELLLGKIQDLPAFILEHLGAQFLHLGGFIGTFTRCELFQVEVYGNLLIIEHEV